MGTHPISPPTPAASHCRWCGAPTESGTLSCPLCGAPLEKPRRATQSGWVEFPQIKDMTRLQVGASRCQIEGLYVPVADFNLAAGDGLYFAHHVLLWKDPQVEVRRMPLKGAFSRMMAGLPIIMTEARGPGHIAFSRDEPGELIALPLQPGQAVHVREHMFLAATHSVAYDWFNANVWFTTGSDKPEYHYPIGQFMDHFRAGDEPGLLLLHAGGNVFVRELQAHETLLIKPTALIYTDPTVRLAMHIEYAVASGGWTSFPILWLHLSGPGKVAMQSAYEPMEGTNRAITGHTTRIWNNAQIAAAHAAEQQRIASRAAANAPKPEKRHAKIERMVVGALVNGDVPPAEVARIVEAAAHDGLTGYDVRLIINQVKARHM